jgi:predicted O-methyltransferase YrrM
MTGLETVASTCAELLKADRTLSYHQAEEPLRLHAIGEASGRLMMLLTLMARPATILELGTGMGYSTLWIAQGAAKVGAQVTTLDRDGEKSATAQGLLRRYALDQDVTFKTADAIEYLEQQPVSPDLVLLDIEKADYMSAFRALVTLDRQRPTILLADNLLSHRSQLNHFVAALDDHEKVEHILIPVGKGIELALLDPR